MSELLRPIVFPRGVKDGLFPPHYMQGTLEKIGGRKVLYELDGRDYYMLLLPGSTYDECTVRVTSGHIDSEKRIALFSKIESTLKNGKYSKVNIYDYELRKDEEFPGESYDDYHGISYGRPNKSQAIKAKELQRTTWNSESEFLYSDDFYDPRSGSATQIVAMDKESGIEDDVVGSLLGFYGEGKTWRGLRQGVKNGRWIESQIMAVSPEYRRKKIAEKLKYLQREEALAQGIDIIKWTVDPLQWPNAVLNFNKLGAVAVCHRGNLYPFQNDLNKVPASRLEMTWLLNSSRVKNRVTGNRPEYNYDQLSKAEGTEVINPIDDETKAEFDIESLNPQKNMYLVRVPNDWNQLQKDKLPLAQKWRTVTDAIFAKLLTGDNPQYAITGAVSHGNEHYLLIRKISPDLGV